MTSKLKEAREAAGYSIEEISNILKIRKQYIVNLEEEVFDDIPGQVYVDGYTKIYHEFLGLECPTKSNIPLNTPKLSMVEMLIDKKYIIFIVFLILSCQPDELMLIEPYPQYEMIFEESESVVTDGQEYSFEVLTEEPHQLVISKDGNVISKEIFLPVIGINTKHIYTKSLPQERLKLELFSPSDVKSTFIEIY